MTASGAVSNTFDVAAIEAHERDERLRGRRAALVRLQEHVQVAALAEHARDARHQLLAVVDQRIDRLAPRSSAARCSSASPSGTRWLLRTTELIGSALVFPVQVRHGERRLIRADPAGLGVARQELDHVLARQQREPGLVLDRTRRELAAVSSLNLMSSLSRTFCIV